MFTIDERFIAPISISKGYDPFVGEFVSEVGWEPGARFTILSKELAEALLAGSDDKTLDIGPLQLSIVGKSPEGGLLVALEDQSQEGFYRVSIFGNKISWNRKGD